MKLLFPGGEDTVNVWNARTEDVVRFFVRPEIGSVKDWVI